MAGDEQKLSLCWSAAGWSLCQTPPTSSPSCGAEHPIREVLPFQVMTHWHLIRGVTTGLRHTAALFDLFVLLKSRRGKWSSGTTRRRRGSTGHVTLIQEVYSPRVLLPCSFGHSRRLYDTAEEEDTFISPGGEIAPSYLCYMTWIACEHTDRRRRIFALHSAFPLIYFCEKIICIPNIQLASSAMHRYSNQHNTEHFRPWPWLCCYSLLSPPNGLRRGVAAVFYQLSRCLYVDLIPKSHML